MLHLVHGPVVKFYYRVESDHSRMQTIVQFVFVSVAWIQTACAKLTKMLSREVALIISFQPLLWARDDATPLLGREYMQVSGIGSLRMITFELPDRLVQRLENHVRPQYTQSGYSSDIGRIGSTTNTGRIGVRICSALIQHMETPTHLSSRSRLSGNKTHHF